MRDESDDFVGSHLVVFHSADDFGGKYDNGLKTSSKK